MADQIKYNYPVAQLDEIIQKINDGIQPMMTPDLEAEVRLRIRELQHQIDDDGDWDDEFQEAISQHKKVMNKIEDERRKARSRNVIELELTEEELAEIRDGCSVMYVRNDPNSKYNISEDQLASSAEEAEIRRRLESLGKVYYHAEDFKNAMKIITDAIEYSLKHEYPWMSYQEAVEAFKAGRIKYSFGDLPTLFIGFDKQITDPKTLAGIVSGEIKLVDEDDVKPKKKKRKKAEEMEGVYVDIDIIGDAEHKMYVDMHNAGWDTPISLMLKASSTLYNRYVMPPSATWFGDKKPQKPIEIDWAAPGAGEQYYDMLHDIKHNQTNEIVAALQDANGRQLNQVIGDSLRQFPVLWKGGPEPEKFVLSTSLEENQQAVAIEQNILNRIRQNNPNL